MDIFLNKDIVENLDLSNYDIATYVAIRSIYHSAKKEFYISTEMLAYELHGRDIPERAIGQIKASIVHLAEFGLYDIVKIFNKQIGSYVLKDKSLYFDTNEEGVYFTIISSDEVRKIMTLDSKKNKAALLRFFINVVGTFNRKHKINTDTGTRTNFVGYVSQSYISTLSDINDGVAADYFKILEDAKVLYVYRHNQAIKNNDGKLKSITNHYGRFEDRAYIEQFAWEYEENILGSNTKKANTKRALMAKYNFIVSDPEKNISRYTDDELVQIYKYVVSRNEKQQEIGLTDIRDLSVLENISCVQSYIALQESDVNNTDTTTDIDNMLDAMFDDEVGTTEEM